MRGRRREKKTGFVRPSGFGRAPRKAARFLSTEKGKRGYSRLRRKRANRKEFERSDEGQADDAGHP
ncbi:MAG: hypothetical protein MUQ65_03105 [Armatimonadetes bacterium]|nr:hypothetical protein [Armatimonadota bacterium]